MNSIGLDISKSTLSVYIPINKEELTIDNTPKGIRELYAKLKKVYKKSIDNLVFVYEPTGNYSAAIKRFCSERGIKVFMINPQQSKNYAKAIGERNKNDRVDARMLSRAIVLAKEEEIRVPQIDHVVEEIKELMNLYRFTVKQRVQMSNHLESLHEAQTSPYVLKELNRRIKVQKDKEQEIMEHIEALIDSHEALRQKHTAILSIPGIGKVGATVLLHLFLKYPKANQKQIVSLTGLDPIEKESGTSIRSRARISKAGSRLYRGSLFMSAMSATRFNDELKHFYDRLKVNGKHTTSAQIAVMRKLVVIAHALFKTGEHYDAQKYLLRCGVMQKETRRIKMTA